MSAETVVIRNRPEDLGALDAALDRLAERAGLPAETMADIRVVCDEVLNVTAHGFPDGGKHEIEVSLELAGRRLVLGVSDDGVPFDPLAVASPDTSQPLEHRPIGGLGIHLVRHLVDDVTYERRGERNVLTVVKDVDRRAPEAGPSVPRPESRTSGAHAVDGRGDTP